MPNEIDRSNEAPNPVHMQRLEEARAEFLASCQDFDLQKYQENEIDRLRSLVQEHEEYIANLELEAASTNNKIDGLALLLGIMPDTGNRRIIGIIKDEILRHQANMEKLEREADWLAQRLKEVCSIHDCIDCPFYDVEADYCRYEEKPWREAARKAVEKEA